MFIIPTESIFYGADVLDSRISNISHIRNPELIKEIKTFLSHGGDIARELWTVTNRGKYGYKKIRHHDPNEICSTCIYTINIHDFCEYRKCLKCKDIPNYSLLDPEFGYIRTAIEDFINSNRKRLISEFITMWMNNRNDFKSPRKCTKYVIRNITNNYWEHIIDTIWRYNLDKQIRTFIWEKITICHTNKNHGDCLPEYFSNVYSSVDNYHNDDDFKILKNTINIDEAFESCYFSRFDLKKQIKKRQLFKYTELYNTYLSLINGEYIEDMISDCPICLNPMLNCMEFTSKCKHQYHSACIQQWVNPLCNYTLHNGFNTRNCKDCLRLSCPLCRSSL